MEDRKSIKKIYVNKNKQLIKHNRSYYLNNNPTIIDKEYDELKKNIIDLEKKYNYLNHKDSPTEKIGFKPSKNFQKKNHKVPMLSLSNVFDEEDLVAFEKKIKNYLNLSSNISFEYSAEPKIDGISASLTYKNSSLVLGLSRGDGYEGEVITERYSKKNKF